MDLLSIYHQRRSVRSYQQKALPVHIIKDIKEAGRWAASSRNKQARKFILISDEELKAQLQQEAKMQDFVTDAGLIVVGVATIKEYGGSTADVLISMAHMETMAVNHGLGTCWLGVFDTQVAQDILGVPDDAKIVSMMTIGYAADEGTPKEKMPIEDMYIENTYS